MDIPSILNKHQKNNLGDPAPLAQISVGKPSKHFEHKKIFTRAEDKNTLFNTIDWYPAMNI